MSVLACEVCERRDDQLDRPILAYRGVEDDDSPVVVPVCGECAEWDGLRGRRRAEP